MIQPHWPGRVSGSGGISSVSTNIPRQPRCISPPTAVTAMVIGPVSSKQFQAFANETALTIHVRHFPPGTSKWNAIEHELFRAISIHGRGRPLETFETVVP